MVAFPYAWPAPRVSEAQAPRDHGFFQHWTSVYRAHFDLSVLKQYRFPGPELGLSYAPAPCGGLPALIKKTVAPLGLCSHRLGEWAIATSKAQQKV